MGERAFPFPNAAAQTQSLVDVGLSDHQAVGQAEPQQDAVDRAARAVFLEEREKAAQPAAGEPAPAAEQQPQA